MAPWDWVTTHCLFPEMLKCCWHQNAILASAIYHGKTKGTEQIRLKQQDKNIQAWHILAWAFFFPFQICNIINLPEPVANQEGIRRCHLESEPSPAGFAALAVAKGSGEADHGSRWYSQVCFATVLCRNAED